MTSAPIERRNAPAFAHIGITVPSLDDAVAWYRDVLGLELIAGPAEVSAGDGYEGRMASGVFGARFGAMRQAHLSTANGVALELFEFTDPATQPPTEPFAYWRTGPFHLCLVERDIEDLVERIRTSGGRQRTAVWTIRPGEPYRMCYCEDPFGTIVEIYSHSHEQTYVRAHLVPVVEPAT
jgi:catechol 2,3-dioxygenase-like lactoylglutathione lyase family enzyme